MALFAQGSTESVSAYEVSKVSEPKYVFMFIGDGMSSPQINAAQTFNGNNVSSQIELKPLTFKQFPVVGIQYTQDATAVGPDSAAENK